jgi:uncharacterized protein (TIGR00725 family)
LTLPKTRQKLVSVIGCSSCTDAEASQAEDVGRLLAQAGAAVVCGGRDGIMEAACRGAWSAGGLTVGILPGDSPSEANDYLTVVLPTGMGEARNVLIVRAGEAVIAIGGGLGTLSEIAHALRLGKPVIALGTWQATSPDGAALPVRHAATAEQAVAQAMGSR